MALKGDKVMLEEVLADTGGCQDAGKRAIALQSVRGTDARQHGSGHVTEQKLSLIHIWLKAQAAKIPPKSRVYSFVMLVCFMLIYIVVILMQILTSMGGLFG